eukprot:CAMPEP_0171103070 /NCGR_PEP_ID=MMETSP0766_2-20121228/58717_1 /TAXON_ID=439317 /ORGANISM="Gambierdiscus australes, Strain CAWD 149" /LENGTH=349 /DNA_ID=CAMNT_0011563469 /DNA_START=61 /DNA_END=1107 /DNA_ORIENTATION=+
MTCVILASFVMPLLQVWPALTFGFLDALSISLAPQTCSCPVDTAAASRPHDVIVMFVQKVHYGRVMKSLDALHARFNGCFGKDVLLFHNGDFPPELQADVTNLFPRVRFRLVKVGSSQWQLAPPKASAAKRKSQQYPLTRWNYRVMFEVLEHLGYTWVMRMDDDSIIMSCIDYDPFAFLETHNFSHGYRLGHLVDPTAVHPLPELVEEHIAQERFVLSLAFFSHFDQGVLRSSAWDRWAHHNSWMLTRISFWTSQRVKSWMDKVDASGVAYHHSVGDASIQMFAKMMFLQEHEVHHFTDWSFTHSPLVTVVPHTLLPSSFSRLVPRNYEWIGGVRDVKHVAKYRAELNW